VSETKAADDQGLQTASGSAEERPPDAVTLTIDGREVWARKGELVIAAAERHGVYVPRFCYHPRMESVGMCRMCLVDIDTGRGPMLQPSCMIEASDGMVVDTESSGAKKAQEGVLEFLLVNHPLDCPVCDKGGECPLQDQTMAYGPGESRFVEEKRHYEKPIPVSDVVLLDRERCILCDRCTRFAKDVAGDPLIHFQDRGSQTQVNTFPGHPFASYFSGNTVQICPVGALTATPYRFKARPWDLDESQSTCTSCSVGCRVAIQSSRNQVLRYQGIDDDHVNWGWLCDKGRFDFEAVNSSERLTNPLLRDEGLLLEPGTWSAAYERAAAALQRGIDRSGPEGVAVLGGARLTNEAAYAWSKFAKGVIGTDNVDAQLGDGVPAELVLGVPRATIDEACAPGGAVLLLGPDPKEELPVLFLRLRHAVLNDGVALIELSPTETATSELATHSLRYRPGEVHLLVQALLDAAANGGKIPNEVAGVRADLIEDVARLLEERPVTVLLGRPNLAENAVSVAAAAKALHESHPDVRFLSGLRRGNVHGALDMGMAPGFLPGRITTEDAGDQFAGVWPRVPSEAGLGARRILEAAANGKVDTLILLGADPINDFPDRDLAERGLAGARTVISLDVFLTDSVRQADVVLPVAGYAEVPGTTTNLEGRMSLLSQQVTPPGTAQPDWVVAAELARRLGYDLGLESTTQILQEIAAVAPALADAAGALLDGQAVALPLPIRRNGHSPEATDADADAEGEGEGEGAGEGEASSDAEASADDAATGAEAPVEPAVEGPDVASSPERLATPDMSAAPTPGVPGDVVPPSGPPQAIALPDWDPPEVPASDGSSLRLVATRKLYDRGTLVRHSDSLLGLAEGAVVRLNPYDFDRLGVTAGDDVRVASPRSHVVVPARPSEAVPRGVAHLHFNQGGARVSSLVEATALVTSVRVERAS
jgi:NADH-quinone oxidoreductase subunit G